ncbi:hypothetical protein [Halococcus agarilyticus]|uniref:hypothetical protein n=1 Tax=Halococcus agarilyticus TaxID=1232219 RepID=UPI0012AB9717|nr:hypothetical protein [Halococcus agarilyticus]
MTEEGIIASDATKNKFDDTFPDAVSNVAVAIAVENHEEFNQEILRNNERKN